VPANSGINTEQPPPDDAVFDETDEAEHLASLLELTERFLRHASQSPDAR
jgi:hypothetical protein